ETAAVMGGEHMAHEQADRVAAEVSGHISDAQPASAGGGGRGQGGNRIHVTAAAGPVAVDLQLPGGIDAGTGVERQQQVLDHAGLAVIRTRVIEYTPANTPDEWPGAQVHRARKDAGEEFRAVETLRRLV